MDIYAYIVRDHRKVAGLIDDLLTIRLPAVRVTLFEEIRAELAVHDAAEERTFYATLIRAAQDANLIDQIQQAAHEHGELDDLLKVLHNTPISDELWLEKFGELKQAISHHFDKEEGEVFARARQVLTPTMATQLARDMDEMKMHFREDIELNIPMA